MVIGGGAWRWRRGMGEKKGMEVVYFQIRCGVGIASCPVIISMYGMSVWVYECMSVFLTIRKGADGHWR